MPAYEGAVEACYDPPCAPAEYSKHVCVRGVYDRLLKNPENVGPAMYDPGVIATKEDRAALERATVRDATIRLVRAADQKRIYLRDVGRPIGFDCGQQTSWHFVECTLSGTRRQFHGRPIAPANPRLRKYMELDEALRQNGGE